MVSAQNKTKKKLQHVLLSGTTPKGDIYVENGGNLEIICGVNQTTIDDKELKFTNQQSDDLSSYVRKLFRFFSILN